MPGKSQKIRLKEHLWSQLDGMASGMGASADALLARAVTVLLNLHGYSTAPQSVVGTTDPGSPPFRVQPTMGAAQPAGLVGLKKVPATMSVRLPRILAAKPSPFDDDRPTQISAEHARRQVPSAELAAPAVDSGQIPGPAAAGELVTAPAQQGRVATVFPASAEDDDEPPFVSDVIPVPPELYAPDEGAPAKAAPEPEPEPEPDVPAIPQGIDVLDQITHALERVSEVLSVTHGLESELGHAQDSELTHGLDSELTHAPEEPEALDAHTPVTEVPPVAEAESHGVFDAPAALAPPTESETQAQSPVELPWHPEPEPVLAPREPSYPPVEEAPVPEAPPRPLADADPVRIAAAQKIRTIAAELERWVLPRADRAFSVDAPPLAGEPSASPPKG